MKKPIITTDWTINSSKNNPLSCIKEKEDEKINYNNFIKVHLLL